MLPNLNIGLNSDLKSGHPILEFTNTVGNHASEHPGEHLFSYGDLLSWMGNIGLLQEGQVQVLKRKAAAQSEEFHRCICKVTGATRGNLPNVRRPNKRRIPRAGRPRHPKLRAKELDQRRSNWARVRQIRVAMEFR